MMANTREIAPLQQGCSLFWDGQPWQSGPERCCSLGNWRSPL